MSRDPAFPTITRTGRIIERVPSAVPSDALAAPSNDDLITAALAEWPQGPAWDSPFRQAIPLTSFLALFTRVLVDPFVWLYGRAFRLVLEASPTQTSELLDQWEADYGLPDTCFSGERTTEQRMRDLIDRFSGRAVFHPEEFVALAADHGFEIEIEEPVIFGCGLSECGGFHETGAGIEEIYWIVRVRDNSVSYFECSTSECGFDPLFSFGLAEELLCLFRRIAPAWTIPVLEPWITLVALVTEDNEAITDEYGNALLVPV